MYSRISLILAGRLAILGMMFLVGCSSKPGTVALTGTVKFDDGAPADGAYVIFESMERPMSATAIVGADGTFSVRTFGANDGIVRGQYKVVVTPPAPDDYNRKSPIMKLDPKYKRFETSGLEFTVEGNPKPIDLVVTRK